MSRDSPMSFTVNGSDAAESSRAQRERNRVADEISAQTLDLAKRARAVGLISVSRVLEAAALEAASVLGSED